MILRVYAVVAEDRAGLAGCAIEHPSGAMMVGDGTRTLPAFGTYADAEAALHTCGLRMILVKVLTLSAQVEE